MKKANNEKNYIKEISEILNSLEGLLSVSGDLSDIEQLRQVYSLSHNVNELAGIYGLNSLSGLFTPIEKGLSVIVEDNDILSEVLTGIFLSSINVSYSLLEDPSLKTAGLKTNYNNLKKEVTDAFTPEVVNEDENSFSNKRFQEIFIEEAFDLINQLEEKLLQLESEKSDLELVDNIFRIMHTLKGNSNMFGFKFLGEITHHLENIYDAIRSEKLKVDRTILNITLQSIDHFRNLIEDVELNDTNNKLTQEQILGDIAAILDFDNQLERESKTDVANTEESSDLNTYYLFFEPEPNIFNDGSNPLYFVCDLYELGNCNVIPVISEIPIEKEFNTELCYTSWHILISTKESKDSIADNFMFLRDESQPRIELLDKGDLLRNDSLINSYQNLASSNKSIVSELTSLITEVSDAKKENATKEIRKSMNKDSSIASIRVPSSKVDLMMNLISELVTKQAELSMLSSKQDIPQLHEVAESIESISRDLRDNAFSISLIPIDKTVLRFQRLVRDVSTKFNKKVDFVVEGKETELDKTVIEKIVDPIMHILRNSIDHGIETPEVRRKLGKSETGTITLKAYPSGAHVVIEISDDGSGINVEKVRDTALDRGYLSKGDEFSNNDMLKLILSPGFSTAENISEVSGRGVGMDVVYQKINEIRGELDIHTERNKGTTLTIKLPLTISIIDSLLVKIGATFYLIPLSVVERCAEVTTSTITESKTQYLNLSGEYIPFIDLHKEFANDEERLDYQRLILVNHKNIVIALVVDQIMGNHQAVLKTLGQAYRRQEIFSGASILGNGEVALVLDSNKLIQEFMASREDDLNKVNRLNAQNKENARVE